MKHIFCIVAAMAALLCAVSCSEDLKQEMDAGLLLPGGKMPVHLLLSIPAADPGTRSMVPGGEKKVSDLKMVCFDANGYFLGVENATVAQTSTDPDHGTVTGSVPAATCRVHFIANRPGLDLSNVAIGTSENILMQSEAMTTARNDADAAYISYWGYHKEETVSGMQAYLLGKGTEHIVYLLRDRAQVRIAAISDDGMMNVDRIQSVEWTVSNGRDRGTLAPFNPSDVRDPFAGYYKVNGTTVTGTSVITEDAASGRYEATEADMNDNGKFIMGQANHLKPIYLFEDYNEDTDMHSTGAGIVKLILRVTYLYDETGTEKLYKDDGTIKDESKPGKVKYHTVLLMNQEYEMFHVTRNHTYSLTIKGLPRSLGTDTFDEALNNTNYSNNQLTSINEEATDVTDGTHTLSIKTETGTSVVFTEQGSVTIPFVYMTDSHGDASLSSSNFSAVWKSNEDLAEDAITLTYDSSTGDGAISFNLKAVSTTMKAGKLLLTDKAFGLQRYINVYSISAYQFREAPTLTYVGTRTVRYNGTDQERKVYRLTLKMPSGTNRYPAGLYPLTVRFATQTLSAFSASSSSVTTEGLCGLTMSSTAVDGVADGEATDNSYPWNYRARSWGYWYSYIVLTQDDISQDNSGNDEIDIYFDDICPYAHPSSNFASVGLYFQIQYFGGMQSAYANR